MDAFEIITQVSQQITFDELMRREPKLVTKTDRATLVRLERAKRAAWKAKQEKKKDRTEDE